MRDVPAARADRGYEHDRKAGETEGPEDRRCKVAEEVGRKSDGGGPSDSAERVPEEERAPAHVVCAREP